MALDEVDAALGLLVALVADGEREVVLVQGREGVGELAQ
jgi:hypothetical protein